MNIFVILISALLIIIVLLRRRVPIGPAILTAGIFIWATTAPQPHYLWNAWIETFSAYRTYDLIFALYFVMCLEIELRTGGILDDLVRSLHRLLKSPRLTLAIMPAFLGLLPSLGGARFSAPIVEITAKGLNLTAEHKANINFWFRHIFEFSSPIIPGMLMACSIAAIPFSSLLLHLAWVTPLFFLVGWLILMRPLKLPPHIITETGKVNFIKELKTLCFAVAPAAIKVELTGKLPRFVKGKDVILTLIGMIGVDGARYQSLEFCGDGVAELEMADRFTICNMAIEAGAKNGIFPVDEKTKAYLKGRVDRDWQGVEADADANYVREIKIELDKLVPVVAYPHLPENTHPAAEGRDIKIDQVVVGSCTNGRLEDLAQAAEVLKGRKVHPSVRCIIIPATQEIYKEAMKLGYIDTFIDAGAAVSTPTCGPCLGGYMGILAAGERAVSTTNRNFRGRMGHVDSEVYLASPYTAAASAVTGYITSPEEVMK